MARVLSAARQKSIDGFSIMITLAALGTFLLSIAVGNVNEGFSAIHAMYVLDGSSGSVKR